MQRVRLTLLGLACAACAARQSGVMWAPRVPSSDVDAVAAYIGAMRGAAPKGRMVAERLDDAEFRRRLHEQDLCGDAHVGKAGAAVTWSAFGLVPGGTDVDARAYELIDVGVSGFYDPSTRHLVVRKNGGREDNAFTIPHEIEHALQAERVGLDLGCTEGADTRTARRAIYEGDATITSAAYEARHRGETDGHAIARVARRLATLTDDELSRTMGRGLASKSPPAMREVFAWPYVQGSAFVAQLFRAGGWPLVDAAMRAPPATTEQVNHVEKYLAGEPAIEVATPEPPPQTRGITHGRMGELMTASFLAQCLKREDARAAASGWGGDAYTIVATTDGRPALLWSTAWDDEASAERFLAALEARRSCASAERAFSAIRQGFRVGYAQGLDPVAGAAVATRLLANVRTAPPAAPPLGAIALRPPAPSDLDFEGYGRIDRGVYWNPVLGLRADVAALQPLPIPRRDDVRGWGLELMVHGPGALIGMRFAWAPVSQPLHESELELWVTALRQSKAIAELPVYEMGKGTLALSWATGTTRTLRFGDSLYSKVALVPMCGGEMTLIVDLFWNEPADGLTAIDRWRKSLVPLGPNEPPMCAALRSAR